MLSSCLESLQRVFWNGCTSCTLLTALCCPGAFAAETYFQPELSARAEYNTNQNLTMDSELEQGTAADSTVFIEFGYRGFGPRT